MHVATGLSPAQLKAYRLADNQTATGPNNVTDVWAVHKVNPQNIIHLTEKPTDLAIRAIQYSSRRGENVLDLFAGSGSTLIGAEQTGRRAFLSNRFSTLKV